MGIRRKCGATLTQGKPGRCSLTAGWGTDHPGAGQCKFHGGCSAVGARIAAPATLELLVGYKIDIGPLEALLTCVRIAAAEVQFFSAKIAELGDDEIAGQPYSTEYEMVHDLSGKLEPEMRQVKIKEHAHQLHLWVVARQKATEALARYAKQALEAGVEERMVQLAERAGDQMAMLLSGILDDLKLSEQQQTMAPAVIRQHLGRLEAVR